MGCPVFLVWEDIVEVNSKMLFTFVAVLMSRALGRKEQLASSGFAMELRGAPVQALGRCCTKCAPRRDPGT